MLVAGDGIRAIGELGLKRRVLGEGGDWPKDI